MRCLAFLSFFLILCGCKSSGGKDLPYGLVKDSIISRTLMINILADVHVIEAVLQFQRNKNGDVGKMEDFYYDKLFSKYKMSKGRFELNLNYYEMDPENFRKMYDEVVKKIETSAKMADPNK